MLFFRSEEHVREWCHARATVQNPIVSMPQLWQMADRWYGTRLTPTARRPGPDAMRRIFAEIGLTGPFWDPRADTFT
jgi:hypothetical protein